MAIKNLVHLHNKLFFNKVYQKLQKPPIYSITHQQQKLN
jgi:hypothetical protein